MENNTVGMVRKVDNVGRIVIPVEIYRQLNIMHGDEVDITATNEGIFIKKHEKDDIKADINTIIEKYEYDGINNEMVKKLKMLIK